MQTISISSLLTFPFSEPFVDDAKNESAITTLEEVDGDINMLTDNIPDTTSSQNDLGTDGPSINHTPTVSEKLRNIRFDYRTNNVLDNWSEENYIAKPYLLEKIIRASRVRF